MVVSGKVLTVVMILILLATGGLFYGFTTAYANYNAARRQTERCWRELATILDLRYRRWDVVIDRSVEAGKVAPQTVERWRAGRDRFSGTALPAQQVPAAQSLEELIGLLPSELSSELPADAKGNGELKKLTDEYSQAFANQKRVGQSLGSRMLKLLLNLPDPSEFGVME